MIIWLLYLQMENLGRFVQQQLSCDFLARSPFSNVFWISVWCICWVHCCLCICFYFIFYFLKRIAEREMPLGWPLLVSSDGWVFFSSAHAQGICFGNLAFVVIFAGSYSCMRSLSLWFFDFLNFNCSLIPLQTFALCTLIFLRRFNCWLRSNILKFARLLKDLFNIFLSRTRVLCNVGARF